MNMVIGLCDITQLTHKYYPLLQKLAQEQHYTMWDGLLEEAWEYGVMCALADINPTGVKINSNRYNYSELGKNLVSIYRVEMSDMLGILLRNAGISLDVVGGGYMEIRTIVTPRTLVLAKGSFSTDMSNTVL